VTLSCEMPRAREGGVRSPLDATEPRLEVEVDGAAANEMVVEGD